MSPVPLLPYILTPKSAPHAHTGRAPCTPGGHWDRVDTHSSPPLSVLPKVFVSFQHSTYRSHPTVSLWCQLNQSPTGTCMSLTSLVYCPCHVWLHRATSAGPLMKLMCVCKSTYGSEASFHGKHSKKSPSPSFVTRETFPYRYRRWESNRPKSPLDVTC